MRLGVCTQYYIGLGERSNIFSLPKGETAMEPPVDLERIRTAHARIEEAVHRTPLLSSTSLGEAFGAPPLWMKCENLQKTGSFKVRGALAHVLDLGEDARERGVVTISAGNHAQALAWAAGAAGVPCTVVMPEGASRMKARASADYGAEVILHGTVFEAFEKARELAEERQLAFVHPFDDPAIVAGQGTVGLEILDDLPEVGTVVVPVGGGGLIAGIATALAHAGRDVRVFGVEPEGAAAMSRSLEAGEAVHLEEVDTVADGLAPPMAGAITYAHVAAYVEDVVTVSDREIVDALREVLTRAKLVVEPAGAAAVAALRSGRIPVRPPVVAVLSGGNVDPEELARLLGDSSADGGA